METPYTKGNVVWEQKIGATTVRICDDYCRDTTPEQVEAILKHLGDLWLQAVLAMPREEARAQGYIK